MDNENFGLVVFFVILVCITFLFLGYLFGIKRNLEKDDSIVYNYEEYRIISSVKTDNKIIFNVYNINGEDEK